MYSYEECKRAVELYIQYGRGRVAVVQDSGYLSIKQLRRWYRYGAAGDMLAEMIPRRPTTTH